MAPGDLAQLELLAEVDALEHDLRQWAERTPDWAPGQACRALVERLVERTATLRVRFEAPLVVATLGGTGTGKSALVNALVGSEVTTSGRERPTTRHPTLVCHPRITPEMLGIDPQSVHLVQRDLPELHDLVLLDCPDPDTTEEEDAAGGTNLARLRALVPHCDVLLITATQQKYRSARVLDELAAAAPGARLVFVQTHADLDEDIRQDWRQVLADEYRVSDVYFVDSLAALADARAGIEPRGDFARLTDLLTRELAGAAGHRIRRANFLDLVEDTLAACQRKIELTLPAVDQLEASLAEQRSRLAARFAASLQDELITSRRPWENRLLSELTSRWGISPFSLVLRGYQSLGSIASGLTLMRARTPVQLALWGAWEGGRALRRQAQRREADSTASRAATLALDDGSLRTAAIILDGYASEAGLSDEGFDLAHVEREGQRAASSFLATASSEIDAALKRLTDRHAGWFVRMIYEVLFIAMVGLLLYRLGKNFFWDSWFAPQPMPILGMEFFVAAGIWLLLWSMVLIGFFTARLRRGLRSEIAQVARHCANPSALGDLFGPLDEACRKIRKHTRELERLRTTVGQMKSRIEQVSPRLGHRVG